MSIHQQICAFICCFGLFANITATETENLDLQVLPALGKVVVDGNYNDWDLSAGIFTCGDVENSASSYALWFHAMYDKDGLYLLARWVDKTPMNNPGSSKGDYGFKGDSLQVRIVTAPDVGAPAVSRAGGNDNDAPLARTSHLTCWRDKDGVDLIDIAYGRRFNEGGLKNAKTEGAQQAFHRNADGTGYSQEISLPWKLLSKPDLELTPGSRLLITIEPNFTVGSGGRLSIKDIFKPGVGIDRVFTFQGNGSWGYATLAPAGKLTPRPVRLADSREFPVTMEAGLLTVNWTGVIKDRMPEGFLPIKFSLPKDGYVSLNIFAPDGTVARQLLTSHFFSKGDHEVLWDGLTTMSVRRPGNPLPPGDYTWEALYHTGIGLRLRGWAGNSGPAPWEGWGADHGNPVSCASASGWVYVGWSGGEGDKPLVAADLEGNIRWKNIRGGIAGASLLACDGTTVFAFNSVDGYAAKAIYRLDARTGQYTEWSDLKSTDLTIKHLWGEEKDAPQSPSGLAVAGGRVFVTFSGRDALFVIEAKTGKVLKKLNIPKPGDVEAASSTQVYVVSRGAEVIALNTDTGEFKTAAKANLEGKDWVSALAMDTAQNLYLGIRGERHHVQVFGPNDKFLRTIGSREGRALAGPWTPDGMYNVSGLTVDSAGKLWVTEDDGSPRRVSIWDTHSGAFKKEFFGASAYGASGAAINPEDPYLMVGQGCEWRIDPKTGRATCLGTITRDSMGSSRFGYGSNGRLYMATTPGFLRKTVVRIYERLGDANYKLRSALYPPEDKSREMRFWADENDDAKEQPEEVQTYNIDLGGWFGGWYLCMTPDMSFYGTRYKVGVTGYTVCGAPQYDLNKAMKLAAPKEGRGGMGAQMGLGSADGKLMLYNGGYGEDHTTFDCYDIASGRRLWTYPNNFTGVHGSHRAVPAEVGMIRGAYDIVGTAKLPSPVGCIWVIPSNKGEWHVLSEKGFYLTRLFEGNAMKNVYPEQAVPGAILDACPPGAGEEAFGGSISQGKNGSLSVQVGHISFWNVEVGGLDSICPTPGGRITLSAKDLGKSEVFRQRYLASSAGPKWLGARKQTPQFTGNLDTDFAGTEMASYKKDDASACRTAAAWDQEHLYVGWEVKDATPWVNGADAPEFMYARGDTVDLQLGTDPKAAKDRKDGVLGDLRVSIGPFQGKPTVVIYRKQAKEKKPKSFNSGVVKNYEMESVIIRDDLKVEVKTDGLNKRYIVEAALPLKLLGLEPQPVILRADFGVTFGNKAGNDTALRSYWSNQNTGLVSDEVFELQMTPAHWGELSLRP